MILGSQDHIVLLVQQHWGTVSQIMIHVIRHVVIHALRANFFKTMEKLSGKSNTK